MKFVKLEKDDKKSIMCMSALATGIVREHYDPILGPEQNDYMLQKFQSKEAVTEQIEHGYQYYFACDTDGNDVGFMAFYKRDDAMYLSKLYLKKEYRGLGYSKEMIKFVAEKAKELNLASIELNVNKENFDSINVYEHLGFIRIRSEKNDIGNGFYMDDYVYKLKL